jgi:hypothetical protein
VIEWQSKRKAILQIWPFSVTAHPGALIFKAMAL